jgi:hypothetical protein
MRPINPHSRFYVLASSGILTLSVAGCPPPPPPGATTDSDTDAGSTETTSIGIDTPPTTGDTPTAATCNSLRTETQTILGDRCGACHGAEGKGGLNNITDLERLLESGRIKAKDPAGSPLFQRIVKEEMPPVPPPVPAGEQDVIAAWITECSVPPGEEISDPRKPPECGPEAELTPEQWIDLIDDDLSQLDPNIFSSQRYISFIDLYNAGYCEAQLTTYGQALTKLLNSLSRENDLAFPAVVEGSHGAIFRIDLRHYGWTTELWDQVACANPFSIDYGVNALLPRAKAIQLDTKSSLFVQPGRSFMHIVARAPLYHDILEIPATLAELALLRSGIPDLAKNVFDEQTQLKEGLVDRAGFYDSGVSFSNRMIERHKVAGDKTGYFWLSHDFADNDGDSDIFRNPLDFKAGGGEIIFSLPNGMQGYMIVDDDEQRVDEAPTSIVFDPDAEDGVVRTAISCIGCHAAGIIPKADELRAYAEANPDNQLTPDEILGVQNLHPQANALDIQAKDSNRFMGALNALGVPHVIEAGDQLIEPIRIADLAFEDNIDLPRVATEIGTVTDKVISIMVVVPDLGKLLIDGTLSREDFQLVFPASVEQLQIGDAQPIAACTPG